MAKQKNPYGHGITERQLKWLRRAQASGGFFITGPNMLPRKGFSKGWPGQKAMGDLFEKAMIYRNPDDAYLHRGGEIETYFLTANAVHVLARGGGYAFGKRGWAWIETDGEAFVGKRKP